MVLSETLVTARTESFCLSLSCSMILSTFLIDASMYAQRLCVALCPLLCCFPQNSSLLCCGKCTHSIGKCLCAMDVSIQHVVKYYAAMHMSIADEFAVAGDVYRGGLTASKGLLQIAVCL